MIKTYKVIKIEDYGVVVDGLATEHDECYVHHSDKGITLAQEKTDNHGMCSCEKVIATIGKRIDGVPLIELANDIDDKLRCSCPGYGNGDTVENSIYIHGWVDGYKANTAKYSEEDIRRAWELGSCYGSAEDNVLPEAIRAQNDYLQSLQKQPIPTEIELETFISVYKGNGTYGGEFPVIHNTETNTITAVNYKI